MLRLERLAREDCDWTALDALPDRVIGQTAEWLSFVAETQSAEPVLARVADAETTVGYFSGLVVRRFGVRILGSPFSGWTTPFMGFNLTAEPTRPLTRELLRALEQFAFGELGCLHIELRDRQLRSTCELAGWEDGADRTLVLDLAPTEDKLLSRMSASRRRNIRLAERNGIEVEYANEIEFAEDYYAQLEDVFAKRGLVPTYGIERVRSLITHLLPTGRLLLLRARAPDGRCVATGIYPGFNGLAQFWGGASWRADQHLRPNEAVMWHAIRYWRDRGVDALDMGYGADYKRTWGDPVEQDFPCLRRPRLRGLLRARSVAKEASQLSRRARGVLRSPARVQ